MADEEKCERELMGWGRHPRVTGVSLSSESLEEITPPAVLSRGLGRAYGDASLPPSGCQEPVASTTLADRVLHFDRETGVLRAEAGLSLGEITRLYLPHGFFTPVSPGTKFVTLGGMVASDIHGKNHHSAGCIGNFVRGLRMRVADGRILEVSPELEPELFYATLGGMGLTGHILEVELTLEAVPSAWIWQESRRYPDLESIIEALTEVSAEWPMTVAWIDTTSRGRALGRGIVGAGRWASASEAKAELPSTARRITVPDLFPSFTMNPATTRIMNSAYYALHGANAKSGIQSPDTWFYPLDFLHHWNRGYGRRGFTQHQVVLPNAQDYRGLLEIFQQGGGASFVTVFKNCSSQGPGMLSFPKLGTSLAMDFPVRGETTQRLIDRMNEYALERGGRVYLAKDALTRPEHFRAMYPRLSEWEEVRHKWDPERRLSSALSVRLLGDPDRGGR